MKLEKSHPLNFNENQYAALCLEFNNTNETKNHIAYLHFIKKSFLLAFPTENLKGMTLDLNVPFAEIEKQLEAFVSYSDY